MTSNFKGFKRIEDDTLNKVVGGNNSANNSALLRDSKLKVFSQENRRGEKILDTRRGKKKKKSTRIF